MHEPGVVHFAQSVQHRQHQFDCRAPRQPAVRLLFQIRGQIYAFQVVHYQIGGPVHLEVVQDPHQMRMLHLGQGARFLQEGSQPLAEQFLMLARIQHHRVPIGRASDQIAGIVFLDRHLHVQLQVKTAIGNTEPTLTQFFADHIPFQLRADRQQCAGPIRIEPILADRTYDSHFPFAQVKTPRTGHWAKTGSFIQRPGHRVNLQ